MNSWHILLWLHQKKFLDVIHLKYTVDFLNNGVYNLNYKVLQQPAIVTSIKIDGVDVPGFDAREMTYIMNVDGVDAKPIIEGKRLYSVNIEGNYIYYSDVERRAGG